MSTENELYSLKMQLQNAQNEESLLYQENNKLLETANFLKQSIEEKKKDAHSLTKKSKASMGIFDDFINDMLKK